MKWPALILAGWALGLAIAYLTGCGTTCQVPVTAFAERDQATGLPIVSVRCGDLLISRAVCRDGGGKRRTATGYVVLCDGDVLATVVLAMPVTEVTK